MADDEGTTYIADCETNGLLADLDRLHCLVLADYDTTEVTSCADQPGYVPLHKGVRKLRTARRIVGHNFLRFDSAAIAKVYPADWNGELPEIVDTMILAQLFFPDLSEMDNKLLQRKKLPPPLYGKHSLKAWGYRLGIYKGDYDGPWDAWSKTMQDYCEQDIVVTTALYRKLRNEPSFAQAIRARTTEHAIARLCAKMETNGFAFDKDKAVALYSVLKQELVEIEGQLQVIFPPWTTHVQLKTKVKTVITPFNPASRQHIEARLKDRYGWKPSEYTAGGQAKVDDDILGALPYPEAKALARYFLLQKRIGQIAEGKQAWLLYDRRGFVHTRTNPLGTVTRRASHSSFNIGQVPSTDSEFGHECRECFTVPPGWKLVGADMSGLELRCLAHFMSPWDNGAYVEAVVNGSSELGTDVHSVNMRALGLTSRADAKTFIYAFLYGAGPEKLGSIVRPHGTKGQKITAGKRLQESFLSKVPALAKLKDAIAGAVSSRGHLWSLDRAVLHVRHAHAALNTLLQSAGAVLCKEWLLIIERKLEAAGLKHGWDGQWAMCAWVHDEVQIAVREGHEETVARLCVEAARETGEVFDFKCPLDGAAKIGSSWAETH